MTIPDYQSLMLPVLVAASKGEARIGEVVEEDLANQLGLSPQERSELLPSGKQTLFGNRVHWAKTYLAQAAFVENTTGSRQSRDNLNANLLSSNSKNRESC